MYKLFESYTEYTEYYIKNTIYRIQYTIYGSITNGALQWEEPDNPFELVDKFLLANQRSIIDV
jgi:hypothetical protein